ncbi:hypothetical protein [Nostoc sp. FACHB-145]|uniref:hypothetical protein n=1 Tax=Nostoc sp. FACHB-145 TaxID=2692836 RepID=UPI001683466C|nr:hypothetical protein [Nostoc sp. FACHB-145]MBD2471545.1 hypothetical protein [Nostoc sp. FACHB-145]
MTDFFKFAQQAIQSAAETAAKAGENISNAASQAGQAVTETAAGFGSAVGSAASQAGQAVTETAAGFGGAVGSAASQAGQAVTETAVGFSSAVSQTGQAVTETAVGFGSAVGSAASQAGQAVTETAVGFGSAVSSAASQTGQAVTETAAGFGSAVGGAASQTGQAVTETAASFGSAVGGAASQAGQAVTETAAGFGSAVGGAASQAGQAVTETAAGFGSAVGGAASQAGQAVIGTAVSVGGAVGSVASQATEGVGHAISMFGNNPQFQQVTKALQVDWLISLIDQVDVVKAETEVKKLQQQYPKEQASEIAHRLMLDKALVAGGMGFASSSVPGAAIALFAVDLLATCALQAEMVYQIACAYGLDLQDPARKGEILAIFGLSLGGGQALKAGAGLAMKAGLVFLESIPFAGSVIGASANAAMIYALGYGACRFYEAKINPLTSQATLAASQEQSNKYLTDAIAQEAVMDQILVHVVLAGNPGKTRQQILLELQTINLSPVSLEAIASNIDSPVPLEVLLNQINRDFGVPLLAQCHRIAQMDGIMTPEETKVIDIITKRLS